MFSLVIGGVSTAIALAVFFGMGWSVPAPVAAEAVAFFVLVFGALPLLAWIAAELAREKAADRKAATATFYTAH